MKPPVRNCAIYTRKSSEEGLDQDFNSLDAQRESCQAYIASQKAEGWVAIKENYDDGGFSGGNVRRPALQKLLEDIKAGKIHIIVVYKIDRLTRSLMDFAKLVEIFDQHQVTFVSVTQSFNTTNSMGRLTLNVLLSFAQFEREVTGERIRDKIAASKKKGMWMGGTPPLGYDLDNHQLLVNDKNAKIVRHIFERYLELGCVSSLQKELKMDEYKSPLRVSLKGNSSGNCDFSRGILYKILSNTAYIGRIKHKDLSYDGLHEPIISQDTWDAVQFKLSRNASVARGDKKPSDNNFLKGILFDSEGTPYSPSYTSKGKKRYRYYISQNLLQYKDHPKGVVSRIPAHEIEAAVINAIRQNLKDPQHISELLRLDIHEDCDPIDYIQKHHESFTAHELVSVISKISLDTDILIINVDLHLMCELIAQRLSLKILHGEDKETACIKVPYHTRKSYLGSVVVQPKSDNSFLDDMHPKAQKTLVRGIVWRDEHFQGMTLEEIAKREGLSATYVANVIYQSFVTLS